MPPAVKFCGLTRPADAAFAAELGAHYIGAIFADSPRRLGVDDARRLFAAAGAGTGRAPRPVVVFGPARASEIASSARAAGAAVAQLHGDQDDGTVDSLRSLFSGEIWSVVRVGTAGGVELERLAVADAVVLDTADSLRLGGTGRTFDWRAVADSLTAAGRPRKLVLAGGLRPSNVGDAIRLLQPDVVDVSSGVESSTGIKDHALMREFMEAVTKSNSR